MSLWCVNNVIFMSVHEYICWSIVVHFTVSGNLTCIKFVYQLLPNFARTKSSNAVSKNTVVCLNVPAATIRYSWFAGLVEHSFWNAHVPRRKRSVLEQYVLSPVGWLHRQLYDTLQELEFSNQTLEQEDVLIFQKSQTSSAEIGLGCLLLKPTASSREESKESHS